VGLPAGFITILAVVLIVMVVRKYSDTESEEKRTQSNPEYEVVGLTPVPSKNQSATQDVPVQDFEYETI